jgi:hypothetical protein
LILIFSLRLTLIPPPLSTGSHRWAAMPLMIKPLNWDDVKEKIISCAKGFQLG